MTAIDTHEQVQSPDLMDELGPMPDDASLPYTKRFLERWHSDFGFRDEYAADPQGTIDRWAFEITPIEASWLIDKEFAASQEADPPPRVEAYRRFIQWKVKHRRVIRQHHPKNSTWRRWRQRQVNRVMLESGVAKHESLVHAPWTAELCNGCSVGCWFCGVSAEKFDGPWLYTQENAATWRTLLLSLKELAGTAGREGFCYWATDPLDNPDWIDFLQGFGDVFGHLPQTTTAIPMRDPEWTRDVLKFYARNKGFVQRFSVTTKKDFEAIQKFFTPEELLRVELIPQFENRASPKATAGRTRELVLKRLKQGKKVPFHYDLVHPSSISCVSGFLISMPDRTVKLITPVDASERWPLGYMVYAQRSWTNDDDILPTLTALIGSAMKTSVGVDDQLQLVNHTTIGSAQGDVLVVHGLNTKVTFSGIPDAVRIAEAIEAKDTVSMLAAACIDTTPAWQVFDAVNRLFLGGVLRDEPATSMWESAPVEVTTGASA